MLHSISPCRALLRSALLLGLVAGCFVQTAGARQWLDKKKGVRFQAEFVRVMDGKVVLTRFGRTQMIPLEDLVEQDLEYIRREMTERGKPWLAAAPDSLRTWTDSQGRTNSGMFVRMQGRDVMLGNPKGTFLVPFELLGADDQDFVRRELTAQGKADQIPSDSPEDASAKRVAKAGGEGKGKAESPEVVGGVVGGRPFDADMAAVAPRSKPAPAQDDKSSPSPPAAEPPPESLASLSPAAPRPGAAPEKEHAPSAAGSGSSAAVTPEAAPPAKPDAAKPDAAKPDAAKPANPEPAKPVAAAASKPAAALAPAAPATTDSPLIKGYSYCSRCKRAYPGHGPGDECPGCGKPLDMIQKLDGTLEEAPGMGFWEQWGTWIIAGCVCIAGFFGYQAWQGNKE